MIKKLSLYTIALLGCLVLLNSCKKEYETIEALDKRTIEEYLAKNNITAIEDPSGFYYQIITPGTEGEVTNQDSVFFNFDFKRANGVSILKNGTYDAHRKLLGHSDNFGFKVIPGVRLTLAKLQKGGTARVILPSRLAFGRNGSKVYGVGSNEIIIIDLALLTQDNWVEMNDFLIDKFVAANNLEVIKDPNRVRYIVSAEGTGKEKIKENSKVKVKYTGRLLNGTVFDSSESAEFKLDGVIEGWTKTIPGKIGVGGKIRLIIPYDLAYKETGSSAIPPYTSLDFDVEILSLTEE